MFPPASPEASHAASLCQGALEEQLSALEGGSYRPLPGSAVEPGPDVPLVIRGSAVDTYVDDELLSLVHAIRKRMLHSGSHGSGRNGGGEAGGSSSSGGCQRIQIVDLACGYGTRPWRLPLSSNVHWFDVDLPAVLQEKRRLLEGAGAQLAAPPTHCDLRHGANSSSDTASGGASGPRQQAAAAGDPAVPPAAPLNVGAYRSVVCHILKGNLPEVLEAHGWDPSAPTIWVAYALVYYLDGRAADLLMKTLARASVAAPCSAFLGTVMNAGMVELIRESAAAAASDVHREAGSSSSEGLEGPGGAGEAPAAVADGVATATFDPETSGSLDAADALRRCAGVQLAASEMKFGVRRSVSQFLRFYGWETVEEVTPADIESMYHLLTVGLQFPEELTERVRAKYGREPMCVTAVARRGF